MPHSRRSESSSPERRGPSSRRGQPSRGGKHARGGPSSQRGSNRTRGTGSRSTRTRPKHFHYRMPLQGGGSVIRCSYRDDETTDENTSCEESEDTDVPDLRRTCSLEGINSNENTQSDPQPHRPLHAMEMETLLHRRQVHLQETGTIRHNNPSRHQSKQILTSIEFLTVPGDVATTHHPTKSS